MKKVDILGPRAREEKEESGPGDPREAQLSLQTGWVRGLPESQESQEGAVLRKRAILAILSLSRRKRVRA